MKLSEKTNREFIESIKAHGFKVKTDTGWSDIVSSNKTIPYEIWKLTTKRHILKCADTHIVYYSNNKNEILDEVYVKDLIKGDIISTDDGNDEVVSVINTHDIDYMYDLELSDKNHRYYGNGILSHNSATARAFMLWYALFNENKVVAILGNKLKLAQEQLQQLRDSYIQLPFWMQPGVIQWNKTAVQFSTNTRIFCSATSPDTIRGMSINLLYLDEFAFVKPYIASEFIASAFPTISSGHTTKVIITSTPHGCNFFANMWEESCNENEIGTPAAVQSNGYVRSEIPWNAVPGRDANWARDEIKRIGEIRFNQEYKCDFVGSVSTLIDHNYLKNMKSKPPIKIPNLPDYIRIYYPPIAKEELDARGWEYVASLDSGYGIYEDYSVLQLFLVKSNIAVTQVLTMSLNNVDIETFCKRCYIMLRKYYNPSLIIEQNGPGIAATKFFFETVEYENLIHFDPTGRHMGLWASEKTKQNACILFKTYIERGFMHIYDKKTITELFSFGRVSQERWGALGGNHDDHITSAYWIPYYLASPFYYGKIVEVNLKELVDNIILHTKEDLSTENKTFNTMNNTPELLNELTNNAFYLSKKTNDEDNSNDETENNDNTNIGTSIIFKE